MTTTSDLKMGSCLGSGFLAKVRGQLGRSLQFTWLKALLSFVEFNNFIQTVSSIETIKAIAPLDGSRLDILSCPMMSLQTVRSCHTYL